jgi:hypothetical protein
VAEWLRSGLQNRLHQFNSGRGLQSFQILRWHGASRLFLVSVSSEKPGTSIWRLFAPAVVIGAALFACAVITISPASRGDRRRLAIGEVLLLGGCDGPRLQTPKFEPRFEPIALGWRLPREINQREAPMTTQHSNKQIELSDAELDASTGGLSASVCAMGYCATVSLDGLSINKEGGQSAGTQVYNAVMAGMNSVTHA